MTNFTNPTLVQPDDLSSILGQVAPQESIQLELSSPEPKVEEEIQVEEEENIELGTDEKKKENENVEKLSLVAVSEEEVKEPINYETIIDNLAEKGFIREAYEGFADEEVSEETLIKLLEHNFSKKFEEKFDEFFEPLSEYSKKIIDFDINSKGKGVEKFLSTLIEEQNIKNLSIDNEYDQEKVIKQWYSRKENYTQSELDEKILELKDAGLLEKEAKRLKPKLDEEASTIAKQIEEEQRQIKEVEDKVREVYNERVFEVVKKGKIGTITLNEKESADLYSVLTGDETIEMTLPNKQKAKMTPLDAHIFFNKYAKEGSLENLALSALLLTNPKKFEQEYSKKVEEKITKKFIEEHKYNNAVRTGKAEEKKTFTQQNKDKEFKGWGSYMKD